jgi:limonene-1,2-epoxide hydrolase
MGGLKPVTPREVSEAYWAAECERDPDAVMAFYHHDAVYEDGGGIYRGSVAIRAAYERSADTYPGLEVHILREFPDGTAAALEFIAWLTDAAGRRHVVRGVNVVDVEDGQFRAVRSYEDTPAQELGSGSRPAPGSGP